MTRPLVALLLLVPLALALPACKGGGASGDEAAAGPTALVFDVEGMTCGSCESAITGTLLAIDGVTEARASHGEAKVWVTYDPAKVTPEAMQAAIDGLGYRTTGWAEGS